MSGAPKTVGMVSLGCPKALVDSETILTRLRQAGYETAAAYEGSDVVVVNTCGFIDSARAESLDAIAEAEASGRPVVVTGCLGGDKAALLERFPSLAAVTGPQRYEEVVAAVRRAAPAPDAGAALDFGPAGLKLTPRHYAYLKISEGCDHACAFCIIPKLRGGLVSRPIGEVLSEAEALVERGVKELLVVSQDTSAYGLDLRYAPGRFRGMELPGDLAGLARGLGDLGVWVRLHYVYPYPHVDRLIPLMAEGKLLPYLDIPFQHASPRILKAMRRPANEAKTLERLAAWRRIAPDITVRSTFVVGFPGESEEDFELLLEWLSAAELDRVGCFAYENVEGASARDLPNHLPSELKAERRRRLMAHAERISRRKLERKVGRTLEVLIDRVDAEGHAVGRSKADAPEIDGVVHVHPGHALRVGDRLKVRVERADAYDLYASPADFRLRAPPGPSRRSHRVISRR